MEQKHIDATILSLTDEVPGKPGLGCPRLMPWDGALLKQGSDAVGDTVIRLIFHGILLWLFVIVKEPCEPTVKRMTWRRIEVGGHSCQNWHELKRATRWIALVFVTLSCG